MKHSRNEIIKSNVGCYMKRRRYFDHESFKKSDLVLLRSSAHMALSSLMENETSYPNSIMYSCVNNDPSVADKQFEYFEKWVQSIKVVSVKEELRGMLFPLLCHLYIEMLRGGHKENAAAFLRKYKYVSTEETLTLMLDELASVETTKDIEDKDIFQNLRSSKYLLTLSPLALEVLKQYLTCKSHIILLQIINCWFDLEERRLVEKPVEEPCEVPNNAVSCNGYLEHPTQADGELAKLEEIIRLVNEVPVSSAPLLLYSVLNTTTSMTCGRVSKDSCLLASGYNSSDIRLWSLTERSLPQRGASHGSRIRLAVDIDDHENDCVNQESAPNENAVLRAHSGCVQDVAFIPNTNILVSVSMDKTLRAWDLDDYTCKAVYRGHNYPVWCLDVSPLGVYVATGSHDRTARLWSLERNYPLRIFAGHLQDVDCLRFHPNGSYLATGSSDKSVRLWSIATGELVRVLPGHRAPVFDVAFSPDGKFLASAGEDKKVKIWDLGTSALVTELKGHSETVVCVDWSPDGEFLASGCLDNTVRVWQAKQFSSSEEQSIQIVPELWSLPCSKLFSLTYSQQSTPICVAGV